MILADKIIELRKKAGYSQEELAEKMGVSRQSVSKWEGALSIPDLDKILLMSEIFGVSTDYLLKDELGDEIPAPKEEISESHFRKVSMEEANEFIKVKDETAPMVALGVALCILSPIIMFMLLALQISGRIGINENAAGGIGLIALVLLVVPAVALFITSGMKTGKFEYLDVDNVICAIGQTISAEGFETIEKTQRGMICADENSFRTSLEGVFAGGKRRIGRSCRGT